jgi:hypothetical protein
MKALIAVSWAALTLAGCNAAKAEGPQLLSQLGGKQDNAVMAEIQARNTGSLCSLVTSDGLARLMSFGRQAVVDIEGKPAVLSYRRGPGNNQASFTGAGVRVSGDLTRQRVTELGKTVSHPADVEIEASGRVEHLHADWTCQQRLMTAQTVH